MDIDKLMDAIRLCGSQPDVRQCRNCAYYAGGDMSRCIPRMTADAAAALSAIRAEKVMLPCKVGDAAYVIDAGDYQSDYKPYVREKEVTEISWKKVKNGKDLGFGVILKGGDCNTSARYKIQNIGKTVFLTREEAEVALEEMKNG